MTVNIPGIVAVAVFYVAILVIGVISGRKTSKKTSKDAVLLADRSFGIFVSCFTTTATMVGGGYINGSAESAAWNGLVQTQAPVGYCLALLLGAVFYAPKMRKENYITMFDPFQLKYGKKVGAILFIPHFLGDLFWSAAVLAALGATISIILDMNATLAIVVSAAVAIIYTFFGGLYSVAYTDVIQLFFIAIGLYYSRAEKSGPRTIPMADIRKSAYVKQGAYPPDDRDNSRSKFLSGFGSGRVSGRKFGIGEFLNNYDHPVEQMAAMDPLPLLIPLKPFLESAPSDEDIRTLEQHVEKWRCEFKEVKRTTQERFPRRKDWMHAWAEYMYTAGDCGAKVKK